MSLNHLNKYSELTDEQFILIGKIVVEFSNIDFSLDVILCRLLLTSDFSGYYITEKDGIEKTVNKIKKAIKLHRNRYKNLLDDSILVNIENTLSTVNTNKKYRNMFAHSNFSRIDDNKIFGVGLNNPPTYTDKGKIIDDSVEFDIKKLTEIYTESYDIVSELTKIIEILPTIREEFLIKEILSQKNNV